jgi:hypothetical protein
MLNNHLFNNSIYIFQGFFKEREHSLEVKASMQNQPTPLPWDRDTTPLQIHPKVIQDDAKVYKHQTDGKAKRSGSGFSDVKDAMTTLDAKSFSVSVEGSFSWIREVMKHKSICNSERYSCHI